MGMHSASAVKSVAKAVVTIREGVLRGDVKKCAAAYRFARQYNPDLPEAPTSLGAYDAVARVLDGRVADARRALETKRAAYV